MICLVNTGKYGISVKGSESICFEAFPFLVKVVLMLVTQDLQIVSAQDNYPRLTGASWPPAEHMAYCLTASERPLRALKCPTKIPFFSVDSSPFFQSESL